MSRKSDSYRAAAQRARLARHRFLDDLSDTRQRFRPARLKDDIGEAAAQQARIARMKAAQAARRHPYSIAAITAGITAYLFRKPLAALSRLIWVGGGKARQAWQDRRLDNDE